MKVFGVIGYKNSGKTVLMERLIRNLTARGLSVSAVKHAHHTVDIDQPGKDSHRHREAGARQTVLASAHRWALMTELGSTSEPPLSSLLARLDPVDLVLVEGYKRDTHPKIETFRAAAGHTLIAPGDPTVRAVAADTHLDLGVPVFGLDATDDIANFILREVGL